MARKTALSRRPRRFRSSPKLRKTEASLSRARAALRKARGSQGGNVEQAVGIAAGGALAAVADAYTPDLPGGIDPRIAIGGALVAAAAMGWVKGQNANRAALAGAGMLACATQDLVGGYLPGQS